MEVKQRKLGQRKKRADEEKKNGSREVKLRKRGKGADGEV